MRKITLLKKLINDPQILIMPGVHDALSAKSAEKVVFKSIQASGFGLAGSYLGLPDVVILSSSQMIELTRNILIQ